jgi:nucleoside-diphosphate-sugar epimerase
MTKDKGKRILITGASGMIGGLVLQYALCDDSVDEVVCLVRRPLELTNAKINEVVVQDFLQLDNYTELDRPFDVIYHCQGVYTGNVTADELTKITVGYTQLLAKRLWPASKQSCFCLFSAMGADRSQKAKAVFARAKGAAEMRVKEQGFARFHCLRPGYIYPVTPRKEPSITYAFIRKLYPLIRILGPKYSVPSNELASAIYRIGMLGGAQEIYENEDIRALKAPH